ncbi:hypothetical protein [Methanospirillum hungatei]|uniref:hypothetical protein n=1 Tax=Methanospirillum hungatei TaxID=2203 RepID=UPI002C92AEE1|nr:hypothetical protein [Methanospirillum hungatei]HOW04836.1 hypothetical protein [Methanospirillum hungatei]
MGSLSHVYSITITLLVLVIMSGICTAEEVSYLTYNDTTAGFSFAYPEGASLVYAADADTRELAVQTPNNVTMITIVVRTTDQQLEDLTSDLVSSVSLLPEGTVVSSGAGVLGDNDAFFLDYQWVRNDTPVRTYTITTVKDGRSFSVNYDNRADQFEAEKILIDPMIESFRFIERDTEEKYYPGYSYYPGMVYDVFGMPMNDESEYAWYPYSYGWDGSTGYQLPYENADQFPQYTGYNPYSSYPQYQQYPQPTPMPTQGMMPGYTMAPTMMPTVQPYQTPITVPVSSGGDINQLINDGLDYLTKKQYKQAEQNFKTALQLDPSDFVALYGYAKVLFYGYDGREEEALEQVKYAVSSATGSANNSQLAILYTLKAQIEGYLKRYSDALQSIDFVIAHDDPQYLAGDYYLKAKLLYDSGAPIQDAIAAAQKAVDLAPDNGDYISFLSKLKESSGQSSSGSVYPEVSPVPTCTQE